MAATEGKIVVGVDGSDGSVRALRWAIAEAASHRARVIAVHAWEEPFLGELATKHEYESVRVECEHQAKDVVKDTIARAGGEHASVEFLVLHGTPAEMLLTAAREADLLVVGSRGRGGFASLMLGSVSLRCAQHAPCPVVIVPAETTVPD
ncbi:MAG TPA: universal stress protein [Acidimicrobiales bacterium]|nr:universal stress protein [Acidimicrobiales bacterium]